MEYFKDTFNHIRSGWWNFFTDDTKMVVCRKNHTVTAPAEKGATYAITCSNTDMPYAITVTVTQGSDPQPTNVLADDISSGTFTGGGSAGQIIKYGDYSFSQVDCFTFQFEQNTVKMHRTVCNWTDGTHNYSFHVFDDNSTTHYSSFACDNLDLMKPSASFAYPVVKDFDILTGRKSCNSGSSNYVLQPVVAFGGKTPIYTIVGLNNAQLPWFTEIQAGDLTFFTVGSNFAIIK